MEHLHRSSQLKFFFVIYLLITLAVISSIIFLNREKNKEQAAVSKLLEPNEKVIPKARVKTTPPKTKTKPQLKPPVPKGVPTNEPPPVTPLVVTNPPVKKAPPDKSDLSPAELKEINDLYPVPKIKPLIEIVKNWQEVPDRAFPKLVAIKKSVDFQVSENGRIVANGKLPVGSMMVPVKLQGDRLFLKAAGSMPIKITVPVEDTDFKELIESRYNRFVQETSSGTLEKRKAEIDRRVRVVNLENSLSSWNAGKDPRFEPLKTSLKKGEVGTYSLYDAAKWRWGGKETIDGTEYDTAFVLIVSEAAFGVTEREIKALISLGKVDKWIDASTGENI